MKFKKIISLICTLCMVSTYAFLPGPGGSTVSAAATDMASCITSSEVPKSLWTSNCSLTGNGTASVTATGTSTGSMSSYPGISFNTKALGSGTDTIMHLSWTIDNPSNLTINYRYQDSKGKYDLAKWTDTTNWVLTDQRDSVFSAHIDPANYRADWFINLQDRTYRLYFDNMLFSEATIQSGATTIKNLYFDVQAATNYSFTISDPIQVVYGEGATMNDVVAYTFKNRSANNYYWVDNGMGNIGGTDGKRIVGNIDWVGSAQPSYSGSSVVVSTSSNADSGIAYKLRILKSNGTYKEKGCLPQDSENENIIHQSVTITPNLTGNNYAAIGFRGNQSDSLNKYKFGPDNGFVNGRAYHFDILVNNKDMKYWILVDGEKRATGDVGKDRLSNISYTINTSGSDTLLLSNIVTKSYDYTVSMDSLVASLVNASNYNWTFDGFDLYNTSIASGYNTRYNRVGYTGNNSSGYTVTANEDAAYWQYRLGNGNQVALPENNSEDNIIHQHLSFTPYFSSGNKLTIGIRGNNAWQEELLNVNAANGFVSGAEYDVHIIINNKNRDYMFIVDGEIKATGTTWEQRYPYWELVYYIEKAGDSMILKDVATKYYNSTVSKNDLVGLYADQNKALIDYLIASGAAEINLTEPVENNGETITLPAGTVLDTGDELNFRNGYVNATNGYIKTGDRIIKGSSIYLNNEGKMRLQDGNNATVERDNGDGTYDKGFMVGMVNPGSMVNMNLFASGNAYGKDLTDEPIVVTIDFTSLEIAGLANFGYTVLNVPDTVTVVLHSVE